MRNRVFAFAAALILTLAASSCGKTAQGHKDEDEDITTADVTAETVTTAAEEQETDEKDGDGLTIGMLGYVKKSRKASANANASTLYKSIACLLQDYNKKFGNDIIYSNTRVGGFNRKLRETYFYSVDELDYIISVDEYGQPVWVLCSRGKKAETGAYGDIEDIDELRDMKWNEVLQKYGFEQSEYTDIELEDIDYESSSSQSQQPGGGYNPTASQSITMVDGNSINYQEVDDLDLIALSIGMEYDFGISQKPFFYYGVFGRDEPFTADVPWEMPEHGDVEFVIEMTGAEIGRVMCWEKDTDKSLVGSYNLRGERYYLSDSNWDEILEYFGYTQGEYIEY